MNYDQILAFGDSVVFGDELSEDPTEMNQLSFAGVVGQLLDLPVINLSMIGGSNVRSLRLLPEALLTYPNSLVLFAYTSFDRSEFYLPTAHRDIPNDRFHVPLGVNFSHVDVGAEHRTYNDLYLKYFCHPVEQKFNWREYNMLFTVQTLCEKYASDYRQIFLYSDMIFQHSDQQSIILDHINHTKIINFGNYYDNLGHGSAWAWLQKNKARFHSRGHPDKDAQSELASYIKKQL